VIHPHRRFKCPICQALPGEPCLELSGRERELFGPHVRNGVSHWDRYRPPHVVQVFWDKWDSLPGIFLPVRFLKSCAMVRGYYRA
jgi:hypothetical protein